MNTTTESLGADRGEADGADGSWTLPSRLTSAARHVINSYDVRGLGSVPKRIAVTASLHGEGTTTISQTLSVVLADDFEATVCWVDLSWMTPTPRRSSSKKRSKPVRSSEQPGLVAHLAGEISLDDAVIYTKHPTIDLLRPGGAEPQQMRLSARSQALDEVMEALSSQYQFIVFDMPPVLGASAALPLFRFVDTYLLVVRSGVTHLDQIRAATTTLDEVDHLGTILNQHSSKTPRALRRLGES